MKTTIAALMLLISTSGLCHEIIQAGCSGNRLKYVCDQFQDNGKQYVKVHISSGVWGNGKSDTIFKIAPSYSFTIFVPYPLSGSQVITFTNTNQNGSAVGEVHCITGTPCHSLPLKFGKIKVDRIDNETAKVTVEVFDVVNVKQIDIRASVFGRIYVTRAVILPDPGSDHKFYSATIKLIQ